MPDTDPISNTANAIGRPRGARKLYAGWAETYDDNRRAYGYSSRDELRAYYHALVAMPGRLLETWGRKMGSCRAASSGVSPRDARISRPRCWPSRRAGACYRDPPFEPAPLPLPDGAYAG